jgi:hypothetical protein
MGRQYAEVTHMAIETKIEGNKLIITCDIGMTKGHFPYFLLTLGQLGITTILSF